MGLEKINELRRLKGMTVEDLSNKSGVPLGTVKKICAGITTNPNLDTVIAIAQALGCSLDELSSNRTVKLDAAAAHFDVNKLTPEGLAQYEAFIQYLADKYTKE